MGCERKQNGLFGPPFLLISWLSKLHHTRVITWKWDVSGPALDSNGTSATQRFMTAWYIIIMTANGKIRLLLYLSYILHKSQCYQHTAGPREPATRNQLSDLHADAISILAERDLVQEWSASHRNIKSIFWNVTDIIRKKHPGFFYWLSTIRS